MLVLNKIIGLTSRALKLNIRTLTNGVEKSLEVAGLSPNVLNVPNEEVGPGASKQGDYKNPEYFCYDKTSYFEAEIEMLKFRLPQPSSVKTA